MADRKEFEINGKPLSSLRVVDLKQELEKRGLSKSGSKKDLADRLKVQLQLEKLHESASTDEGHVPNLKLQDEAFVEENDLIKDYLAKQQQIYQMQKEARRRVELEEQRVRESSEASAGDTSQEEEELDLSVKGRSIVKSTAADHTVASTAVALPESSDIDEPSAGRIEEEEQQQQHRPTELQPLKEVGVVVQEEEKEVEHGKDSGVSSGGEIAVTEDVASEAASSEGGGGRLESDVAMASLSSRNRLESEPQAGSDDSVALELPVLAESPSSVHPPATVGEDVQQLEDEGGDRMEEGLHKEVSSAVESVDSDVIQHSTEVTTTGASETTEADDSKAVEDAANIESVVSSSGVQSVPEESVDPADSSQTDEQTAKKTTDNVGETQPTQKPILERKEDGDSLATEPSSTNESGEVIELAAKSGDSLSAEENEEAEPKPEEPHTATAASPTRGGSNRSVAGEQRKPQDSPKKARGAAEDKENDDLKSGARRSPSRESSRSESPAVATHPTAVTSGGGHRRRSRRSSSDSSRSSSSSSSASSSRSRSRSRSASSAGSRSRSRSRSASPVRTEDNSNVEAIPEESVGTNEEEEESVSRSSPRKDSAKTETEEEKTMDVDESVETNEQRTDRQTEEKASEKADDDKRQAGVGRLSSRKISLSSAREKRESRESVGEGKENEAEKPQRKRKWGGSGSGAAAQKRTSLTISTDSLKNLIPDVKVLSSLNASLDDSTNAVDSFEEVRETAKSSRPVESSTKDDAQKERGEAITAPVAEKPASKRELIIYRTVVQPVNDKPQQEVSSEKEQTKNKRVFNRSLSSAGVTQDEAASGRKSPSPARYPPNRIIHVRNLVRPYTLNQLKELLSKTGTLVEGGFWIDKIKSKCYVTYETEEQAVASRHALHGIQWPSSNPKRLVADYACQDELDFHKNLTDAPEGQQQQQQPGLLTVLTAAGRGRGVTAGVAETKEWSRERPGTEGALGGSRRKSSEGGGDAGSNRQRRDSSRREADKEKDRDGKRGETAAANQQSRSQQQQQQQQANERGGRGRDSGRTKDKGASGGQYAQPIREWDRDKIGERSPGERARAARRSSRSRSRSRGRRALSPGWPNDAANRRDRDGRGKGGADARDRRDRRERRREDEEAPAKLLDDLFRKTKATPCVYWLPLTAEQSKAREEERRQRQVEREKRRQQLDLAEKDRNGGASLEQTKRNRDRDDGRNRRRSESPVRSRGRRR